MRSFHIGDGTRNLFSSAVRSCFPQDVVAKPKEPSGWELEENKGTLSGEANGMLQADDAQRVQE